MMKAFVDTTVLTNILIKTGNSAEVCKNALKRFSETQLPVYAIKEFKAGPLQNFAWVHNKLVTLNSFARTVEALQQMSGTPKRYLTSTAIQALKEAACSMKTAMLRELAEKYGHDASIDAVLRDQYRLAIKNAIHKAWRRRRRVTSHVVLPLKCYSESEPEENNGLIDLKPTKCEELPECSLGTILKGRPDDLRRLRDIVRAQPKSRENSRRYQALRQLCRKPKEAMASGMCTDLGDAVFALTAPNDAVILTTNVKDHAPLASALGKSVEKP